MDDKNIVSKERALKELDSIYEEIEHITNNLSNIDSKWNDEVGIGYKKRIDKICKKKQELLTELKKFENILKK